MPREGESITTTSIVIDDKMQDFRTSCRNRITTRKNFRKAMAGDIKKTRKPANKKFSFGHQDNDSSLVCLASLSAAVINLCFPRENSNLHKFHVAAASNMFLFHFRTHIQWHLACRPVSIIRSLLFPFFLFINQQKSHFLQRDYHSSPNKMATSLAEAEAQLVEWPEGPRTEVPSLQSSYTTY
jgi:hypothetical protein